MTPLTGSDPFDDNPSKSAMARRASAAALALGRFTGLTGKDEVVWLQACLAARTTLVQHPAG
jgi:hypothetical protein